MDLITKRMKVKRKRPVSLDRAVSHKGGSYGKAPVSLRKNPRET